MAGGLRRPDEALQVTSVIGRELPAVVGGDWNNPYYTDLAGMITNEETWWEYRDGPRIAHASRWAARLLFEGGLHDAAAALGQPRPATAGRWQPRPEKPRPIDAHLVTACMVPALRGCFVIDTPTAWRASDHLPAGIRYDPAAIGRPDTGGTPLLRRRAHPTPPPGVETTHREGLS